MAAYMLFEVLEVSDPEKLGEYSAQASALLEQYGGTLVTRAPAQAVEGEWEPQMLVILQFESMERARACYESAEYAPLRDLRQASAKMNVIMVDGLS